jgi:hypothetical protein
MNKHVVLTCALLAAATGGEEAFAAEEAMDSAPRIVNIINFIRGAEPRLEMDLLTPVVEQIRLLKKYDLPGTFLIQYDAMEQDRFVDLLKKELGPQHEIGGWFEVVQPQVEAAGLKWRGRYPWDWHADVGFSVGYTPAEREKLVDVFMAKFKATFGYLPKSVGSWFMDAHTLAYMADKYGVSASCNCKDQVGTDGYTLWGGYWNQAYYPSRLNALMPAQTKANQIPLPVFRMLGSDPIYQYDLGLGTGHQKVVSLEPVYVQGGGGGDPEWVRWFFKLLTEQPCLAFGYTQMGQENSFGWDAMGKGLTDQFGVLDTLNKQGVVRVETLADSAAWFAKEHPVTPATAMTALDDWMDNERKTVWYNSRFYRANLLWEKDRFYIRDIHKFDEKYRERYLESVVTSNKCRYDTLPVLDGFTWSTKDAIAGMRPVAAAPDGSWKAMTGGEPIVTEPGVSDLCVEWPVKGGGTLRLGLREGVMDIALDGVKRDWALEFSWSPERETAMSAVTPRAIAYRQNNFTYELVCSQGTFSREADRPVIMVRPKENRIAFELGR